VLSLAGAGGAVVPVGAPAFVDVEVPALVGALGTSVLSDVFVSGGTGGTGGGVSVLSVGIGVSGGAVSEVSVGGSEGAVPVLSVVGLVVSGGGVVPAGSVVSPEVPEGAVPVLSVVGLVVSGCGVVPAGSVVSPEVPEGSVSEVSVVAGSAGPVVAPEMSEVAPFETGGGGSSARAVATNAEAQRKVATRATVHPRTLGDRPRSHPGGWMLRTTTQFRSSTLSLTMPRLLGVSEYCHSEPETQAGNAAGRAGAGACHADQVSSSARA
jgi:hypothetical protein